jgi:hypothetical protein
MKIGIIIEHALRILLLFKTRCMVKMESTQGYDVYLFILQFWLACLTGMTRILVGLLLIEEPIYENLDACKHGLS